MSESRDFALKPGAERGDSAFLLNSGRHRLAFDPFPGRTILLVFLGSIPGAAEEAALKTLNSNRRLVDEGKAAFFAVASESGSGAVIGLEARFPSIVFLTDGGEMARAFGASASWVVLDPMLRVIGAGPLEEIDRALAHLSASASSNQGSGPCAWAPILSLSDVFEPELCGHLIDCFERGGGKESGFMQDEGGAVGREFQ